MCIRRESASSAGTVLREKDKGVKLYGGLLVYGFQKKVMLSLDMGDGEIRPFGSPINWYDATHKANSLDFLLNSVVNFDCDDIIEIRGKIREFETKPPKTVEMGRRPSVNEIQKELSEYIKEKAEEFQDETRPQIIIDKGYGYIRTTYIERVLQDLGWDFRARDFKMYLAYYEIILENKDQGYDVVKKIKKNSTRCLKIKITTATERGGE